MKLGLNLAVFSDRTLESALDCAVSQGLETVEINVEASDRLTPLPNLLQAGNLKALRNAIESRGLFISAVGNHAESQLIGGPHHSDTDHVFAGTSTEKVEHGIKCLLATAEIASELEVETVIGFTGCEDWSRWFPWPDPDGWDKMLAPFVATWTPILDRFESLGVRFAHEPHPKQLAYDLETSLKVTEALDHREQWGFNLDPANLSLTGVDPSAFVQHLGSRVYHVHAKDLEFVEHNLDRSGWQAHGRWDRPGRGFRFRVPGWGNLDWKRLLSELQLAGYNGIFSIEHEDPVLSRDEGVTKAVDFLRPLIIREAAETCWW